MKAHDARFFRITFAPRPSSPRRLHFVRAHVPGESDAESYVRAIRAAKEDYPNAITLFVRELSLAEAGLLLLGITPPLTDDERGEENAPLQNHG